MEHHWFNCSMFCGWKRLGQMQYNAGRARLHKIPTCSLTITAPYWVAEKREFLQMIKGVKKGGHDLDRCDITLKYRIRGREG